MQHKIYYREIREWEEEPVCKLVEECFDEFVAPGYSRDGVAEFYRFANPIAMRDRGARGCMVLLALDDEEIVGMIEVRGCNHISLLFVKKQFHRLGIARKLVEDAVRKCREDKVEADYIEVNSSPFAVPVYEKLGFKADNTEQGINGIRFIPMKMNLK